VIDDKRERLGSKNEKVISGICKTIQTTKVTERGNNVTKRAKKIRRDKWGQLEEVNVKEWQPF